jgi:hypothetical protein
MQLIKVISAEFNSIKQRVVKILRYGKSDIQTGLESGPYGLDSNPIKDMIAVYGKTESKGQTIIVGYLNKNQLAATGEFRTFSTDADGNLKFYIWQKADGTCEIGGNTDFMVRFNKANEVVQELQDDITALKQAFTTWVPVVNDGGAALKGAAASWSGQALVKDFNEAKISEIKTL